MRYFVIFFVFILFLIGGFYVSLDGCSKIAFAPQGSYCYDFINLVKFHKINFKNFP
jgi:hypothetical protein